MTPALVFALVALGIALRTNYEVFVERKKNERLEHAVRILTEELGAIYGELDSFAGVAPVDVHAAIEEALKE